MYVSGIDLPNFRTRMSLLGRSVFPNVPTYVLIVDQLKEYSPFLKSSPNSIFNILSI